MGIYLDIRELLNQLVGLDFSQVENGLVGLKEVNVLQYDMKRLKQIEPLLVKFLFGNRN